MKLDLLNLTIDRLHVDAESLAGCLSAKEATELVDQIMSAQGVDVFANVADSVIAEFHQEETE